ncbi:hypothetical protein ACFZB6_23240 [Streptomyces syringium]|uniref:hypothetical protein n=1 Tax=Streptomyces syringium TaxID=76729 RepID=UPI0033AD2AC1
MIRSLRRPALSAALLLPLVLTIGGAAQAQAGDRPGRPASPAAVPAAAPVDRAELEARARAIETAIELIHVTSVPGFEPAAQSVGVIGDDGFSLAYVKGGAVLWLTVDRGTLTEANCAEGSIFGTGGGEVTCEREGRTWYRSTAGSHEYALARDGYVVRLSAARDAVSRDVLRGAAEAAHPANDQELDAVLPPLRERGGVQPDERGDIFPGREVPDNRPPAGAGG